MKAMTMQTAAQRPAQSCGVDCRRHGSQPVLRDDFRSKLYGLMLLLLVLASTAWSSHAAELRIGSAQGYPGDTIELSIALQGDGQTTLADFYIEHSYVAHYAQPAATVLAPRTTCRVEGLRFRVIWNDSPNTDLVQLCTLRLTIYEYEGSGPISAVFGAPRICLNATSDAQPCSVVNGHIDVIYEIERSFIAVLKDPPDAPSLQEVVDFDYSDANATPPLRFVDTVRPEYVRASLLQWGTEYGPWLLAHPESPITQLHERGARFTFATPEQREQALASARSDPAVRDIVETLSHVGPKHTYPVLPRENQPFGLYLVGPYCPAIEIATPESRSIEVVGNQIEITLDPYNPGQACLGVSPPGFSGAVVDMPGLPAGTYDVGVDYLGYQWHIELVIYPSAPAIPAPSQVPNPNVPWWLAIGVLILAAWRFSNQTR
ncbi:MAG: hypothetical protein KDJ14_08690 [Xanthomonadales bacterium]|nr:hypothetical protein [Xanthomonadales bacterium]